MTEELYCDGGVIGRNPSIIGGTWAWCLIRDGLVFRSACGVITPEDCKPHPGIVTNNITELYAAVQALEAMGEGWDGIIHTDSSITLQRITEGVSFANVPQSLRIRALAVRRGRKYKTKLLAGHPTKEELVKGKARRNGNPVSIWNCWCDEQCQRLAKEYQA